MDLDLAVSSAGSPFLEPYQASFAARVAAARDALDAVGKPLPEEMPLPPGFPYRIPLGSYSTGSTLCQAIDRFVTHLRTHGTLPGVPTPARPPAELPECLRPLQWAEHVGFSHDALFVPVELDAPVLATAEGQTFRVQSSPRALEVLRLVEALAWLDDRNMWEWLDVLPEEPGEPFRGYRLMSEGFPEHPDVWGIEHMIEAMRLSVKYQVLPTVS